MRRIFLVFAFFLFCPVYLVLSPLYGSVNDKKPLGTPERVCAGVNIHFVTGHEKDLDMIAAAGFKFIRMDFAWRSTERNKGVYDWSGYEELTSNLEKRGLSAIYILDYSNSLYEKTVESVNPITGKVRKNIASPQHPESVEAFARWSAAAAEHFRGKNIIWEIWNEPNIFFWSPKPDVKQYTTLAIATAKAIREKVPDASIIGPTTSEVPLTFLESFFSSGVLEYLDAVSVHPYRNYSKSPETAATDYRELRKLIERYAPAGKKEMPIISSEWGYATHTNGISTETQAEYIVRMQLSNCMNGIPLSIWYDWLNDGTDPGEREHNFGTVTNDLKPKPAYHTVQVMNHQMEGYQLIRRIDVKNDHDYVLLFRNGDNKYRISAWTTGEPHTVTVETGISMKQGVSGVDGYGNALKMEMKNGSLLISLEGLPQYISLPEGVKIPE
jgi:hypothetical protein